MESLDEFNDSLIVTDEAKAYLKETSSWAKFLAIVGFVFCGLFVLVGLFFGSFIGSMAAMSAGSSSALMGGTFFTIIYVAFGLIYFMPCFYLYKFATSTKRALAADDTSELTEALKNHKSMFKFMGIVMIVVLGIYALFFVFGILGVAVAGLSR